MTDFKINKLIDGAAFIPLQRSEIVPLSRDQRLATITALQKARPHLSREAVEKIASDAERLENEAECWASLQYTVLIYRNTPNVYAGFPPMDHLSIRRDDREPIRDWRHMQAIKNQTCGEDREAIELYPDTRRLVDTANQFHLWVIRKPGVIFPVGFGEREVSDGIADDLGAKQRRGAG